MSRFTAVAWRRGRACWRIALWLAAAYATGCATLQLDIHREASHAFAAPETSPLWQQWARPLAAHPGQSGFRLLPEGLDAFTTLVALADGATHAIDVQYYMIHTDDTGLLLLDHLLAAADRGVRVRLLVDDLYALRSDQEVADLDQHPNFEIRLFNPWRWRNNPVAQGLETFFDQSRINHRMHNKLFVADNAAMVLGGRNLGDEYFQLDPGVDFRDLDVFAIGPIARDASRVFDEFWNSKWAVPITARQELFPTAPDLPRLRAELERHRQTMQSSPYVRALAQSRLGRELREGTVKLEFATAKIVADGPDKVGTAGTAMRSAFLLARFKGNVPTPQKELLISSPYFVPSHGTLKLLTGIATRGVDVRILTNSYLANDVPAVHSGYAPYRNNLLRGGVKLYELKRNTSGTEALERVEKFGFGSTNASLHTKAFVVDRAVVFIGSLNLDPRSVLRNTEDGLIIHSVALAEQTADLLLRGMAPEASYEVRLKAPGSSRLVWITKRQGQEVRLEKEPGIGFWNRFKLWVLRMLPFESQL